MLLQKIFMSSREEIFQSYILISAFIQEGGIAYFSAMALLECLDEDELVQD